MKMKPVPNLKRPVPEETSVLTTTVPFAALVFDRDSRTSAEEYLYSSIVSEFLAGTDTIPPVWCDPVGPDKYQVVIQDENLFNFAAAFLRDRQNIPIVMLASDSPSVS